MRTFNRALAAAGLIALAAPVIGAQDRPESILPPGFGEPAPAATSTPRATATPLPGDPPGAVVQPLPTDTASPTPTPTATPTPIDPATLAQYEMPVFARRSLAVVGTGGEIEADAFGRADGRYLEALMRRTAAPLPSRWLSIALRRLLVSRLDTPRGLHGADFAAERAWLLLRMGESVAARAVVQGVDNANYTPKLYQVAANAWLATGDPAGMCPVADAARAAVGGAAWTMAQPICAALAGDAPRARTLFAAARRSRAATGVDLLLAQKVMGAAGGRQAVTIEWDGVDRLTAWRFGLATATGVALPDDFYAAAAPQATYWRALAPGVPLANRIAAAEAAAGQGVLSNLALVDLYGAVAGDEDAASGPSAAAQDLRTAYTGADADGRLAALRQLWGTTPAWPRLVLTARAAARQPVRQVADADPLVASMLTAGLDRSAARWAASVPAGGDAWAMIALADPAARRLSYADVQGYTGGDARRRLFFAGLAGLGRLARDDVERTAEALAVPIGATNSWTRALDRAVADEQPGTVLLLAAIGMQTPGWRGVPPAALYRIVAGLRAVGLDGEARMIAAEAIARG
ncbi:hypothetical protein [Sphingomonas rubra]|uniref:Uncharacterized protein n=1 Tax=Sphingomonas rubra TaxID=634430 RepID=A0A1I5RTQ6_9SPHN|nr:hypothetical protein [Sphingomonas rubra]SFP61915.1 hypothetical protein SAMN04488241_104118 [Sphingomonas rubra]